jgi:4-hydroxybenzoate polyprenyltransferase
MYYGYFFKELLHFTTESYLIFKPIITIIALFVISIKLGQKWFLYLNLFIVLLLLLLIVLNQFLDLNLPGINYYSIMLFCMVSSAYLGVFEAWRISSHIARKESYDAKKPISELTKEDSEKLNSDAYLYSMSTILGCIGSIIIVPFVFIFTGYGLIFLLAFSIHAMIIYYFWTFKVLGNINSLVNIKWEDWKLLFGFLFLAILIIDSKYNYQPSHKIFPIIFYAILTFLLYKLFLELKYFYSKYDAIKSVKGKNKLMLLVSDIDSQHSFIIILLIIMYILSLSVQELFSSPIIGIKATYACLVYIIFIGLSYGSWFNKNKSILVVPISSICGVLKTTRIITSSIIMMIVLLPAYRNGFGFINSLLMSLPFLLSGLGGFALNDYYDMDKDVINKPNRAIPKGLITAAQAYWIGITLLLLGLLLGVKVSESNLQTLLYVATIFGVSLYNYVIYKFALIKTIVAALISIIPIAFDIIILNYPIQYSIIIGASLLFIIGRELLMDINDLEGDMKVGINTIPMRIGKFRTAKIAFNLQIVGAVLLVLLLNYNYSSALLALYITIISITIISYKLWWSKSGQYQKRVILLMWVPMLCGILMMLF